MYGGQQLTSAGGQPIRIVDVTGGNTLPLTVLNTYSALSVPAYRRAIAFLSENLASFPRSVRKDGAKLETKHALDILLKRRPNGLQNSTAFWRTWFFHAVHTGNGYARITRGANFRPMSFHNLLPEDVIPFRWTPEREEPLQFYFHKPTKLAIAGADMLHLQALGHDGMAGMDPVTLHERTFQRACTIEKYQVQYLRKGTVLRGAIEIPGVVDDEQLQQIRAEVRRFRGAEADDDILILGADAKLNNATTSPQESQLVEQASYTTKQISQITGVPPQFLYEFSESKYNNSIEQMGQDVVRYTFRPWIEQAEDELTLKLLTEREQEDGLSIRLNPGALLRGSTKEQEDIVGASVKNGIRTRNEGRALLDLPPDSDPESSKLKALGDTAPPPAPGSTAA